MTEIDWDAWRAVYDTTSFAEQCEFYDRVFTEYPDQAHYDLPAAERALAGCLTVVEVGGWQGHLARDILAGRADIASWVNLDVCSAVLAASVTEDERYHPLALSGWPWDTNLPSADAFVATHVIEHMRFAEFERLATQFGKYRVVHLEAPLEGGPTDWTGYLGSHIIEVGWSAVDAVVERHGFECVTADRWVRTYCKR